MLGLVVGAVTLVATGAYLLTHGKQAAKDAEHNSFSFKVKHVKTIGGESFWDVFEGDNRIIRYKQTGSDLKSRVFVDSPLPASDPRRVAAQKKFL